MFFYALRVKVRDEGIMRNKAVDIALGVRADGEADLVMVLRHDAGSYGALLKVRMNGQFRPRLNTQIWEIFVRQARNWPPAADASGDTTRLFSSQTI